MPGATGRTTEPRRNSRREIRVAAGVSTSAPTLSVLDLVPVREEFFGKKGPASTLVAIPALAHPDWMIEIEAVAVV